MKMLIRIIVFLAMVAACAIPWFTYAQAAETPKQISVKISVLRHEILPTPPARTMPIIVYINLHLYLEDDTKELNTLPWELLTARSEELVAQYLAERSLRYSVDQTGIQVMNVMIYSNSKFD